MGKIFCKFLVLFLIFSPVITLYIKPEKKPFVASDSIINVKVIACLEQRLNICIFCNTVTLKYTDGLQCLKINVFSCQMDSSMNFSTALHHRILDSSFVLYRECLGALPVQDLGSYNLVLGVRAAQVWMPIHSTTLSISNCVQIQAIDTEYLQANQQCPLTADNIVSLKEKKCWSFLVLVL